MKRFIIPICVFLIVGILLPSNGRAQVDYGTFTSVKDSVIIDTDWMVLPWIAYNTADRFMLGAVVGADFKKQHLALIGFPFYAFGSKSLTGYGLLEYSPSWGENSKSEIKPYLEDKSFHFFKQEELGYDLKYNFLKGGVKFCFSCEATKTHAFNINATFTRKEVANFDTTGIFSEVSWQSPRLFYRMEYEYENNKEDNPFSIYLGLEIHKSKDVFGDPLSYVKSTFTYDRSYFYEEGRSIDFRFHISGFLTHTHSAFSPSFSYPLSLTPQGWNDYDYSDFYFTRQNNLGFASQQVGRGQGGMKLPLGAPYSIVGNSNSIIAAINLRASLPENLPFNIPLRPYFDIGYYGDKTALGQSKKFADNIVWSGGLALELVPKSVEIYFPVIHSQNVANSMKERGGYFKRISFLFDLNAIMWNREDKEYENYYQKL